jgi:hypothetical protein
MKLDSNLLNEAIADAKAVRETAVQTAIGRLKEAFEPTVRQLITQKLSEEGEMPDEEDTDAMVDEEYTEDEYANTNPDYDGLAEEDEMPPAEMPEDDDEKEMDLELESILAELEGEMSDEMPEEEEPAPAVQAENRRLRKELTEAKTQLKEAYRAITTQKNAINEVNLLNSKLLFLTKITSAHKLTPQKQVKILEAFDRARSVREVKLVYATICESLDRQKTTVKNPIVESASRPMRSVKQNLNEQYGFASRWKELAGIK